LYLVEMNSGKFVKRVVPLKRSGNLVVVTRSFPGLELLEKAIELRSVTRGCVDGPNVSVKPAGELN
jgi:hypothetical protein